MQLFDAHCHLQDKLLRENFSAVCRRALAAGVAGAHCCACCPEDWPVVAELVEAAVLYGFRVFPSFGVHPCYLEKCPVDWRLRLENVLAGQPHAGVGEIGLDHLIKNRSDAEQRKIFIAQLELAMHWQRPVTIHCRQAWGSLLEILRRPQFKGLKMMVHAYSGSCEVLRELVQMGAYISFAGNVTFPHHRRARAALCAVPAGRLLLETDAPDMPPAGAAGGGNEPANLVEILGAAAMARGVPAAELAKTIWANSSEFLGAAGFAGAHAK